MDTEEKINLKKSFDLMMQQGQEGCGREICPSPHCKANPKREGLSKIELFKFVMNLQKTTTNGPCDCQTKQPATLHKDEITTLFRTNQGEILTKEKVATILTRVREVFSSFEVLAFCFIDDRTALSYVVDPEKFRLNLDFESLNKVIEFINKESPDLFVECFSTLYSTLAGMTPKTFNDFPVFLRFVPILLENERFFENRAYVDKVLTSFFEIMFNITRDKTPQNFLIQKCFAQYPKKNLQKLVDRFQSFISIDVISSQPDDLMGLLQAFGLVKMSKIVEESIKFLNHISEANKISRAVDEESFYNETLEEASKPELEYQKWLKNRASVESKCTTIEQSYFTYSPPLLDFSLCEYPWVLSCAFKSKLLDYESKEEMKTEMQKGHQSLMRQGQFILNQETIEKSLFLIVEVRRSNLIEDTLDQLYKAQGHLKKKMRVKFTGEQGIDEGGVKKEFFQLITRDLFEPKWGMFLTKNNEQFLWFNAHSLETPIRFELAGTIVGLAIYNSVLLELHFPNVVYKKLMNMPVGLNDVKQLDPELFTGLSNLLTFEGDVESTFCVNFSVQYEVWGSMEQHHLVPGGDKISVTNENRAEYVKLYVDWYLNHSIKKQFGAFQKGFLKVVAGDAIKLFTPEEIQKMICGSEKLDFAALERVTLYDDGYEKDSQHIKDFWSIIHEFNDEQRKKFLFFCTGTDRAPINGLGSLKFIISRFGPDSERLPQAHTCFNHLLLPAYATRDKMKQKLLNAINFSEGFGLY